MININNLPNAWETFYKLGGEQGHAQDDLYDIYYNISTAIFDYRMKHKLSQKQLAEKLGVTQAMVSKLESGDYHYTVEQLWKIAKKLDFRLNIDFGEKDQDYSVGYTNEGNQDNVVYYTINDLAVGS